MVVATEPPALARIDGLDVARALAFAGMLLAHYTRPIPGRGDPAWLASVVNVANGRAAPLFCVLLGLGAGILSRGGTRNWVLVRRGVVLFAIGIAVWPYIDEVYLILPHYGVLLALLPIARLVPTRGLLPLAGAAFAVPAAIVALVDDHGLRATPQPDSYGELFEGTYLVRELSWGGGYPLVGWAGFALVGLWCSRQDLRRRSTVIGLLAGGVVVTALQPVLNVAFEGLDGNTANPDARGWSAFLDTSAHSNMTAWYVSSSATAVAVIALCLLVVPRARTILTPVRDLGRMALTAYLGHLWLGVAVVFDWRHDELPTLDTQLGVAALTLCGFVLGAFAWSRVFPRGPLEAVVRTVAR